MWWLPTAGFEPITIYMILMKNAAQNFVIIGR
jgi:hypothetical protein